MKFEFFEELKREVEQGNVYEVKHPEVDYYIYNYTPKVQYDKLWNDVTIQTRGLILDSNGTIIARPFKKFFNLGEEYPHEIPNTSFKVYEKLDGSLGILYWVNDKPYIASRGSFSSDQSIVANEILYSNYSHFFPKLDRTKTYLFEIIYPENKIVVNYGQTKDLVLLATIDTYSGKEEEIDQSLGFPVASLHSIESYEYFKSVGRKNAEGFVLVYDNGFRLKVKHEEYVKLHKIVTQLTPKAIWEYYYLDKVNDLDNLIKDIPDELYPKIKEIRNEIEYKYNQILNECLSVYKEFETRKETALYFQKQKYPNVLFSMLNKNNNLNKIICKHCKPQTQNSESL